MAENGDSASLQTLVANATAKYAVKHYDEAAELYAFAVELQAKLNGEMSSSNADLLFAYGRCLYHVAVAQSEVLGSGLPEKGQALPNEESKSSDAPLVRATDEGADVDRAPAFDTMPGFHFDEEQDDDEDENDDSGEASESESRLKDDEPNDDFANAFEVLDLARILLEKQIEESSGSSKDEGDSRRSRERLAETLDLQGEISLEGENFHQAVVDLRKALDTKRGLYPTESSLLAEAHFKLSLALEFASIKDNSSPDPQFDQGMRGDAAKEMQAAIASCRLRVDKEKALIETDKFSLSEKAFKRTELQDVCEMIVDMEKRLKELAAPHVPVSRTVESMLTADGVMRSLLEEPAQIRQARLEKMSETATDLSALVKRPPRSQTVPEAVGKRKNLDEEPSAEHPAKIMKRGD